MSAKLAEYQRGWRVLFGATVGMGCGVVSLTIWSLGPFVEPLAAEFGWTRAAITAAIMAKSFGIPLAGIMAGHLADKYGSRKIALVSQFLLAFGVASLSFVTDEIWTLYLGYLTIVILGAGTLQMIWARNIVGWFVASRGVALALSVTGLGIVGALIPSYVTWLMAEVGWRGAYVGLAALPLLIGLPITLLFFKDPPPELIEEKQKQQTQKSGPDTEPGSRDHTLKEALKTARFWWLGVAFMLGVLVMHGLLINVFPLLTDRGLDRETAAMLAGLFGIAGVAGRLISGALLDSFGGRPTAIAILFLLGGGSCLALLNAGNSVAICAVSIFVCGIALGAEGEGVGYLTAKYFGRKHYGVIYATLYTFLAVGMGFGPVLISSVYDRTGSYDWALIGSSLVFLVASIMLLTLREPRQPTQASYTLPADPRSESLSPGSPVTVFQNIDHDVPPSVGAHDRRAP